MSKDPFSICSHVQTASNEECTPSDVGEQRSVQRWCKLVSIPAVLKQEVRFKSDEGEQQEKSLKIIENEKDVPTNELGYLIKYHIQVVISWE